MIAILIGAGVSGVVLGAASRMIFLLPAALMALVVAAVLIVRADIDLGFTALAAALLNGGFLLGLALVPAMPRLLASPPWTIDETEAAFMVRDRNGEALACVSFERTAADSLLTRDEARGIALNIAKLPDARSQLSHARCKNLGGSEPLKLGEREVLAEGRRNGMTAC
jgi:hypothetical protein